MKTRFAPESTCDSCLVLRVGLLTFSGVSVLTMLAATFLRVTVQPTMQWSLRMQVVTNVPRAFLVSSLVGLTLATVIMAGMMLVRRFENIGR